MTMTGFSKIELRPSGSRRGGGEADFPLRNLPHLWGRGTAIAVEGALPKVTLTVRRQYLPAASRPPTPASRDFPRRGKQVLSLRRTHPLTAVCFAATAGPRKEGALVCSKGANLGPAGAPARVGLADGIGPQGLIT